MSNSNVNLRVSGGSRKIYKKLVHSNSNLNLDLSLNLNFRVSGVSMYNDSQESLNLNL